MRRGLVRLDRPLWRIWILVNYVGNCWVLRKDCHCPISVLEGGPNDCIRKEIWWARQKKWEDQDQEVTVVSQTDKNASMDQSRPDCDPGAGQYLV